MHKDICITKLGASFHVGFRLVFKQTLLYIFGMQVYKNTQITPQELLHQLYMGEDHCLTKQYFKPTKTVSTICNVCITTKISMHH